MMFDQLKDFVYKSVRSIDSTFTAGQHRLLRDIMRENDKLIEAGIEKAKDQMKDFERMLMVPGIIGPGEIFENLRGFLSYTHSHH
jgi:hypothetical protein